MIFWTKKYYKEWGKNKVLNFSSLLMDILKL